MTSISAPRLHRTTFGRTAAATAVGTAMEMYDFVLYGTAASLVFNKIFFPSQDPVMGTLAALGTFGVGFLARPIGGVVFGHLGDRIGRKTVLVITMLAMGLLSTFIGLLPTYAAIGVAAPTLLVVLRLLQGVAMGGEQGGAFVMAAEAGSRKRGFLASWPAVGMTGGLVLATLIFGIFSRLPEDQFMNWGWRVPFLLSLVLVGVGIAVRLGVPESQTFEKIQERKEVAKAPLAEAVRTYWKQILQVIGMKTGETAAFFFLATFSITYGVQFIHLDRTLMLNAVLVGALAEMIAAPLWGLLSDRVGRRPVMMFGAGVPHCVRGTVLPAPELRASAIDLYSSYLGHGDRARGDRFTGRCLFRGDLPNQGSSQRGLARHPAYLGARWRLHSADRDCAHGLLPQLCAHRHLHRRARRSLAAQRALYGRDIQAFGSAGIDAQSDARGGQSHE